MWTPGSGGGGGGGGGVSPPDPAASTDNAVARWDGADGSALQDSAVTVSDAGVVSGATQLNVDNLRLDGNTISTQNSNGDLIVAPNGTGQLHFPSGSSTKAGLAPAGMPSVGFSWPAAGGDSFIFVFANNRQMYFQSNRFSLERDDSTITLGGSTDAGIGRAAAAVLKLLAGASGLGALRCGQESVARTTDLTLTTAESGIFYHNTGAGGQVVFSLPAATLTNGVGAMFGFCVRAAQNIRVVAAGTDVINLAAGASAAGGRVDSATVRSFLGLYVSATGFWDPFSENGTWAQT